MNEQIIYEQLIRASERLSIAREYVKETRYPERDVLMSILGVAEKEKENETI